MTRTTASSRHHVRRRLLAVSAVMATAAAAAGFSAPVAQASRTVPHSSPSPSYTVSVGTGGSFTAYDDTPVGSFIAPNGQYYFQESASLYGANLADNPREWDFYTGTNMDTATYDQALSTFVNPANSKDSNGNTTWRCNNSPTGKESTYAPSGSSYAERNYCDLESVWVDPDNGDWYGLVHDEFTPQPFGDGYHYDSIDYAMSSDQGRTWKIEGHVVTSPYATVRDDSTAFPEQSYYYGDGDPRLYVDDASGYFYLFYTSRTVDKTGGWVTFYEHVARAPIADHMASSSWHKYYDGSWSQPGTGGKESNVVPVTPTSPTGSSSPTGYTAPSAEYKPTTPGTVEQQVAEGLAPPTSPLDFMDVTYDAYLGVYISEPQAVNQSGNAPQQFYWTKNLATEKWHLLGDTGSLTDASWYRWFLDSVSKTSGQIVGKTFRSYCEYACADNSSGSYANITVTSSSPAPAPFDLNRTYRIVDGQGRALAQVSGSSATESSPASGKSVLSGWRFWSNGDGSYSIVNAKTGKLLGVDSKTNAGRAWGDSTTVASEGAGGPTVGQQWFLVRNTSPTTGQPLDTFRLVNRYSDLALGLPSASGAHAETVPVRTWTHHGASPAQQVLTIVAS